MSTMPEQPTRTPIDFRTKPPKLAAVATAWQACWDANDTWDGAARYADLDAAQHHAAVDYIGEEHCWLPGDDPADEAPDVTLTWERRHQQWHLLADGKTTGVRLYETHTYAAPAPATPAENAVTAVRAFADDMRTWCSPHGVAAIYADRLTKVLDNALAGDTDTSRPISPAVRDAAGPAAGGEK